MRGVTGEALLPHIPHKGAALHSPFVMGNLPFRLPSSQAQWHTIRIQFRPVWGRS